jgi:hypothetical protein
MLLLAPIALVARPSTIVAIAWYWYPDCVRRGTIFERATPCPSTVNQESPADQSLLFGRRFAVHTIAHRSWREQKAAYEDFFKVHHPAFTRMRLHESGG